MMLHAVVPRALTYIPTKPGPGRDGSRLVFAGPSSRINHQARSVVKGSASRVGRELHPAKIVQPEAYRSFLQTYNGLYWLVSFSGVTISSYKHGSHTASRVSH